MTEVPAASGDATADKGIPASPLPKKPRVEQDENVAPTSIQINPDHEYRLTGVVSHLGDRANAGHYVADVCTAKGWRRYNDTLIRDGHLE